MASYEMIHQTSCSYIPQDNDIAERKHSHMCTLLIHVNAPIIFRGDVTPGIDK